jgi:hypothetical protein
MLKIKKMFGNVITQSITVISSMSYDPVAHMNEIEANGDVSRSDWYRMIRGHEVNIRERERERE